MKSINKPIFILIILSIVLILVGFYTLRPSIQKSPKPSINQPLKTLPSFRIKDGKLPLPIIFSNGSFSGTLTYQNAISIAREYYDKKAYQDALIWAYRADSVSYLDAQAWMLYALCLYKLDYKIEAYATLRAYQLLRYHQ